MNSAFHQVDVFAGEAFGGNPLAVVVDGSGLTDADMRRIARWTNLSETTFLLPSAAPEADYRVRIFTLSGELPFAGHPTLGSCHVWLAAGGRPKAADRIVQECGAGLVLLARRDGRLAFRAPPLVRSGPLDPAHLAAVTDALGLGADEVVDSAWVDNGPGWVGVLLRDADAVLAVRADVARYAGPRPFHVGLVGAHPAGGPCAWEVRALFTDAEGALVEDPVTGSLNASLAQWLLSTGRATAPYVAAQGTHLGRAGRVFIDRDAEGAVWVGGDVATRVTGEIELG